MNHNDRRTLLTRNARTTRNATSLVVVHHRPSRLIDARNTRKQRAIFDSLRGQVLLEPDNPHRIDCIDGALSMPQLLGRQRTGCRP